MAEFEEKKSGSDVFAEALRKKKLLEEQAGAGESSGDKDTAVRPGVGFGSGVSRSSMKETTASKSAVSEFAVSEDANADVSLARARQADSGETAQSEAEDGIEFFEIGEMEGAVVEAGEPDITGKAAIAAGGLFVRILRPFGKLLGVFFAPVIKPFKKGAGKITARDWTLFIALVIAVAVAVVVPNMIVRMQNTSEVSTSMYSPMMGRLTTWEGGTITVEDNVTWLTMEDGTELNMTGFPFYYSDGSGVLLPDNYMWYSVDGSWERGKLERYSTVSVDRYGACTITFQDGTEFAKSGFLYDNSDTYIFLESVTLEYNDTKMVLQPLSFVKVSYGTIQIYNYGQEDVVKETLTSGGTAYFDNGARTNVAGDILYAPNGSVYLIHTSLENEDILTQ